MGEKGDGEEFIMGAVVVVDKIIGLGIGELWYQGTLNLCHHQRRGESYPWGRRKLQICHGRWTGSRRLPVPQLVLEWAAEGANVFPPLLQPRPDGFGLLRHRVSPPRFRAEGDGRGGDGSVLPGLAAFSFTNVYFPCVFSNCDSFRRCGLISTKEKS